MVVGRGYLHDGFDLLMVMTPFDMTCDRNSSPTPELLQASALLGMDSDELGGALRRRRVRVTHAGRESLHEAVWDGGAACPELHCRFGS